MATVLVWTVLIPLGLWSVAAIYFFPLLPRWGGALLASIAVFAAAATSWLVGNSWATPTLVAGLFGSVATAYLAVGPALRRKQLHGEPDFPRVKFDGDHVTMRGALIVRTGEAEDRTDRDDWTFDLNRLESAWLGVLPFPAARAIGHTFVSFGFDDGRFLAVSVQSRRPEDAGFSPLAGLFKNYGLIYSLGDERQAMGMSAVRGEDPIYLYPLAGDVEVKREVLRTMLQRAQSLVDRPEFYHTLFHNCTTNLVRDLNRVAGTRISPFSPRIILSGLSARAAYDHGLIDTHESFEDLQQRAQVDDLARQAAECDDFSVRIRARFEKRALPKSMSQ